VTHHEFVLGIDDKYGPDSEWEVLFVTVARIDHAIGSGNGTIGVTNNGELNCNFIFTVGHYITEPFVVGFDCGWIEGYEQEIVRSGNEQSATFSNAYCTWVHTQCSNETIHGLEFVVFHGQATNLGGADGLCV
jgi:hypothetical protein